MGSAISMQTKTSLLSQGKQFILLIIIFTLIDVAGPIIFNIEQGGSIKHIFSILCFSTFFASIIISIIALFGKYCHTIFAILSTLYTLFSYANLLYHRSFNMYFPIRMIFEFQQLNGLWNSIFALIRWYDFIYICLCILIFVYIHYSRSNFNYKNHIPICLLCVIATYTPVWFITNRVLHWDSIQTCKKEFSYTCRNNPVTCYIGFGLFPIIAYQLQNAMPQTISLTEFENTEIDQIIKKNRQLVCDSSDKSQKRLNIVIILMESLNTACISLDIMPTLYKLSQNNTTLFCPNINQLTQAAASIGGQFVVTTGLSGLRQSVFVTDYPHNQYPSIVKELSVIDNNIYSFTIVSTHRHFWRQSTVCESIGMIDLFDQNKDMKPTSQNVNALGWVDDKIIFEVAANKIPLTQRSFCALIVPSNMHVPYTFDSNIRCDISFPNIEDDILREYMRRARYADEQLTSFIQALKDKGLYDDTLIVVTSDHQVPKAYCSDAMKESLSPYIPAIFINTGADWTEQNERNKDVVFCHSQVYPTMLQLMGLRPEKYAGLFPPMTNIEATQEYDFANCAYETTTDKRIKQIYDIEEKIIRSSYFGVME